MNMYTYIYTYIHTYTYTHIYTIYMYTCMKGSEEGVCVFACMYECVCVCVCVCVCTPVWQESMEGEGSEIQSSEMEELVEKEELVERMLGQYNVLLRCFEKEVKLSREEAEVAKNERERDRALQVAAEEALKKEAARRTLEVEASRKVLVEAKREAEAAKRELAEAKGQAEAAKRELAEAMSEATAAKKRAETANLEARMYVVYYCAVPNLRLLLLTMCHASSMMRRGRSLWPRRRIFKSRLRATRRKRDLWRGRWGITTWCCDAGKKRSSSCERS